METALPDGSEEFQEWYYKEQVAMMERMPAAFVGLSPWILNDFKSPRRNNPTYQQGWNRKGLFGEDGKKKKAFFILKAYYDKIAKANATHLTEGYPFEAE